MSATACGIVFKVSDLQDALKRRALNVLSDNWKQVEAEDDARILALTLIGEARGESLDGRVAVAYTVRNRAVEKKRRVADVCLQKWQYSCWVPQGGVDNHDYVMGIAEKLFKTKDALADDEQWHYSEALLLARGVLAGALRDRTGGATHYITLKLYKTNPPAWVDRAPSAVIGNHAFFAGIPWG